MPVNTAVSSGPIDMLGLPKVEPKMPQGLFFHLHAHQLQCLDKAYLSTTDVEQLTFQSPHTTGQTAVITNTAGAGILYKKLMYIIQLNTLHTNITINHTHIYSKTGLLHQATAGSI